jgi:hypothetical protein
MALRPRQGQRRGIPCLALLGVIFAVALTLGSYPSLASAAAPQLEVSHAKRSSSLVRQASISLGSCSAKDVVMRVAIARSTYVSSQPVDVIAVIRNMGKTFCTYGGTEHGNQTIGPCGAFSMTVLNGRGLNIWPGPVAPSCPMIGPTRLAPGARVVASGTWPRSVVTREGSSNAPPGRYRLIIEEKITLGFRLK